ncbi:substrate-binding periplasmic protein [Sneathiella limimaris]|uniref:substrate-binding periplasmic protein n=1 Tax=Sneathiella limimaris TaxID=1964213 RepID=UPI0019D25473|nr:transporter substrate-binding domain-containing protein [Sneathiella limimaris]
MSAEQPCLKIAYWELDTPEFATGLEIVQEAYEEAGICHKFLQIPYKRSEQLLKDGTIDADMWRLKEYTDTRLDWLVPIPEALLETEVGIVFNTGSVDPNNLQKSLEGQSIGTILGTVQGDQFIQSMGARRVIVDDHKSLFFLLKNNRLKAAILSLPIFESLRAIHNIGPEVTSLVIQKSKVVHVLAKKHEHLVPRLNTAFQKVLKKRSFFDRTSPTN